MNPTDRRRPIPLVETPVRWPLPAMIALCLFACGAAGVVLFNLKL